MRDLIEKYGILGVFSIIGFALFIGLVLDFKEDAWILDSTQPVSGVTIIDNKVVPLTKLTDEQMKIQEEEGCIACH